MGQSAGPRGQRPSSNSQSASSTVCLGETPFPSLGLHLSTWKTGRLIQDALETTGSGLYPQLPLKGPQPRDRPTASAQQRMVVLLQAL